MSKETKKSASTAFDLGSFQKESARLKDMIQGDSATAKAMDSMRKHMEEIQRLSAFNLPRFDLGPARNLTKAFEEQQRQWREIAQPLEKIRSGLLIENQFAKIIAEQTAKFNEIKQPLQSISESLRLSLGSIQSGLSAAASSCKSLLQDFDEIQRLRLEEMAKPFQLSRMLPESAFSETLKLSFGQLAMAKTFQIPALDPIAASAIAKLWEAGDLQERIRFFSEDMERILQEAEAAEPSATAISGAPTEATKPPLIRLDFWTIFNILNVLLTLAILSYQETSSSRMEARISGKIENGNAALQAQIAGLQSLLVQAMSARQPWEMGQTQFVVRSRVARIRRDAKLGSPIVAEVFPNQVVALLGERGKWIHIEYYDWLAAEKRQGWALKKYFVRVRPTDSGLTNSEDQ